MDTTKRQKILERDNRECQLSKLFGISELTGVPCSDRLEVHHKTYARYGYESEDDLITVCVRCHDVITSYVRELRYGTREYSATETERDRPKLDKTRKGKKSYEELTSETNGHRASHHAQWTTGITD